MQIRDNLSVLSGPPLLASKGPREAEQQAVQEAESETAGLDSELDQAALNPITCC